MKRRRWWCRLVGHRFISPFTNQQVHIFLPSAEGSMSWPDERPIGICDCGERWER